MLPGIHASVSGGLNNALETLKKYNLQVGQIFTSNQQQWKGRAVKPEEKKAFQNRGSLNIISHASYLINLATLKPKVLWLSKKALAEELQRMHELGIRWLVLHPGAHLGPGEEEGIEKTARRVKRILEQAPVDTGILFENTTGSGTVFGYTFEHLKRLLDLTDMPKRAGICFDTCHAFGAGYDMSTIEAVDNTMREFDNIVGLDRIRAFHMNDSQKELGSRKDRHARIGGGLIGLEPLQHLANMEIFSDIPAITETPGTNADRVKDVLLLTHATWISE